MNGPNWLMMMNYALVLVVVVAWAGLFISVGWELAERRVRKAREMATRMKDCPRGYARSCTASVYPS